MGAHCIPRTSRGRNDELVSRKDEFSSPVVACSAMRCVKQLLTALVFRSPGLFRFERQDSIPRVCRGNHREALACKKVCAYIAGTPQEPLGVVAANLLETIE